MSEAAVARIPYPFRIAGPKSGPTLAACNQPVNAFKVELVHGTEERLGADESDGSGNTPQEVSAPSVLVRFDGDAHPNMRRPRQTVGHSGKALRSLGEDLIDVPIGPLHRDEYVPNELVGHLSMEQVGHGVDEDAARLLPAHGKLEARLPEAQIEALFVMVTGNATEALGKGQRIAVIAAGRNLSTPGNRIPCRIGPLDGRTASHCRPLEHLSLFTSIVEIPAHLGTVPRRSTRDTQELPHNILTYASEMPLRPDPAPPKCRLTLLERYRKVAVSRDSRAIMAGFQHGRLRLLETRDESRTLGRSLLLFECQGSNEMLSPPGREPTLPRR